MPIALILVGEVDNREMALKVISRRYLRVEPRGFHDELNVGFDKESKDYSKDNSKVPWNAYKCHKEEIIRSLHITTSDVVE